MLNDSDIKCLKEYFSNRCNIAFAFLFGSRAKGNATKLSDIDIAVYFYPAQKHPIESKKKSIMKPKTKYGLILKNV